MPDFKSNKCNDITFIAKATSIVFAGLVVMLGAAHAQTAPAPGKLKVIASFSILADMTRQVAGDLADVTSLVGPNADAHVYRATPADAKALRAADLIIINGLGFEGFMPRLIASSGSKADIITVTKGLKPLEKPKQAGQNHGHDHGKIDPHAWQSIDAVKLFVGNIRDGLSARHPAGAVAFKANADAYIVQLDALKLEVITAFDTIPEVGRILITNHDAFGYFARDFKFQIAAVQGVSTESEPSARDVARIIRAAKDKKARAVFIENFSDPRIGAQLAKETGAKLGGTLFSDALSDEKGPAATYIAMMRHNARTLVEALRP